jgi:hypothetical protein
VKSTHGELAKERSVEKWDMLEKYASCSQPASVFRTHCNVGLEHLFRAGA